MAETRETEPRRRRRGGGRFAHAGAALGREIAEAGARHGFSEPSVLLRWPEIVGADIAPACRPVKVSYPRAASLGATLVVEASGARATEIEHRGPQILESVNRFYGYKAVARLKITQAAGIGSRPPGFADVAAGFSHAGAACEPDERPVTPAASAAADRLVADVQNPRLKAGLARLGALVLSREDDATPDTDTSLTRRRNP